MEEMDGNETLTVPLTHLAELYDVLIEGNLVEINNFAKNNYGRELDGTELMFISKSIFVLKKGTLKILRLIQYFCENLKYK